MTDEQFTKMPQIITHKYNMPYSQKRPVGQHRRAFREFLWNVLNGMFLIGEFHGPVRVLANRRSHLVRGCRMELQADDVPSHLALDHHE